MYTKDGILELAKTGQIPSFLYERWPLAKEALLRTTQPKEPLPDALPFMVALPLALGAIYLGSRAFDGEMTEWWFFAAFVPLFIGLYVQSKMQDRWARYRSARRAEDKAIGELGESLTKLCTWLNDTPAALVHMEKFPRALTDTVDRMMVRRCLDLNELETENENINPRVWRPLHSEIRHDLNERNRELAHYGFTSAVDGWGFYMDQAEEMFKRLALIDDADMPTTFQ